MRVAVIKCCLVCPYFAQDRIDGKVVWKCTEPNFNQGKGDGRFNADGSYPADANRRVAAECGLTDVDIKK